MLNIDRNNDSTVNISSSHNRELINKYILPIISRNAGWGCADIEINTFWNKSDKEVQIIIDSTLGPHFDSTCWVLTDEIPAGLFQASISLPGEVLKPKIGNPLDSKLGFYNSILEIISNIKSIWWNMLKKQTRFNIEFNLALLDQAKNILGTKTLLSSTSLVIAPQFQGKGTAYTERLYGLAADSIFYGWTSNPIIIAKHYKNFTQTSYFPLLGDTIDSPLKLIGAILICADFAQNLDGEWRNLEFGASISPYNIEDRGTDYMAIAKALSSSEKITPLDCKRIEYVLTRKFCASAIISV